MMPMTTNIKAGLREAGVFGFPLGEGRASDLPSIASSLGRPKVALRRDGIMYALNVVDAREGAQPFLQFQERLLHECLSSPEPMGTAHRASKGILSPLSGPGV